MTLRPSRTLWLFSALLSLKEVQATTDLVIACVGDSITEKGNPSYPSLLETLLNERYNGRFDVANYGKSGSTVQNNTADSYWLKKQYRAAMSSGAGLFVNQLGTNDAKLALWDAANFRATYLQLLDRISNLNQHPIVIVCAPPPYIEPEEDKWGPVDISPINTQLTDIIQNITTERGYALVNNFARFQELEEPLSAYYKDGIHPNEDGTLVLAENILSTIEMKLFDNGINLTTRTPSPTLAPSSYRPTTLPEPAPTYSPTNASTPTSSTLHPSVIEAEGSSYLPTHQPASEPVLKPTSDATRAQPSWPTGQPWSPPSYQPSRVPTRQPSSARQPSSIPTRRPSNVPTSQPSSVPTRQSSHAPTSRPSSEPTRQPSIGSTWQPSSWPTHQPSSWPTHQPSSWPTHQPSSLPTSQPSSLPTPQTSSLPTPHPSSLPTPHPSSWPTLLPSSLPTPYPSSWPTPQPSSLPTPHPSSWPTTQPSSWPVPQQSSGPTPPPSSWSTPLPSSMPTSQPSGLPSGLPSSWPTRQPIGQSTIQPTSQVTRPPSSLPTRQPLNVPQHQPTIESMPPTSTEPTAHSMKFASPSSRPVGPSSTTTSPWPSVAPAIAPSRNVNESTNLKPSLISNAPSLPQSQLWQPTSANPFQLPTFLPTATNRVPSHPRGTMAPSPTLLATNSPTTSSPSAALMSYYATLILSGISAEQFEQNEVAALQVTLNSIIAVGYVTVSYGRPYNEKTRRRLTSNATSSQVAIDFIATSPLSLEVVSSRLSVAVSSGQCTVEMQENGADTRLSNAVAVSVIVSVSFAPSSAPNGAPSPASESQSKSEKGAVLSAYAIAAIVLAWAIVVVCVSTVYLRFRLLKKKSANEATIAKSARHLEVADLEKTASLRSDPHDAQQLVQVVKSPVLTPLKKTGDQSPHSAHSANVPSARIEEQERMRLNLPPPILSPQLLNSAEAISPLTVDSLLQESKEIPHEHLVDTTSRTDDKSNDPKTMNTVEESVVLKAEAESQALHDQRKTGAGALPKSGTKIAALESRVIAAADFSTPLADVANSYVATTSGEFESPASLKRACESKRQRRRRNTHDRTRERMSFTPQGNVVAAMESYI